MGSPSDKQNQDKSKPARRGYTRLIGTMIPKLTRRALGRHGFDHVSVITDWDTIVGKDLAACSQPVRLSFPKGQRMGGTLHIRVTGPLAVQLQHMTPILIERINTHFGYGAVADVRLHQAPIRKKTDLWGKTAQRPAPPSKEAMARLDGELAEVEDEEIRAVLRRLGESVLRQKNDTKSGQ